MIEHFNKNEKKQLPQLYFAAKELKTSMEELPEEKMIERPFYVECSLLSTSKYKTSEHRKLLSTDFNYGKIGSILSLGLVFLTCLSITGCHSNRPSPDLSRILQQTDFSAYQSEYSAEGEKIFNIPYPTLAMIEDSIDLLGNQLAATKLVNIGEYQLAQAYFDKGRNKSTPDSSDAIDFTALKSQDFKDFIVQAADENQCIFFNEAHHRSDHRQLVASILPILKSKGYTHIGFEAFNNMDTNFVQRGYPLTNSGFYTQDPTFGNLLREAHKLDFTVFGYEANSDYDGPAEREEQQANHIVMKIPDMNNTRFVILGGFDHIREDTLLSDRWGHKAMAKRFSENTGINPLTVDQYTFSDKLNVHPYYSLLRRERPLVPVYQDTTKLFQNPFSKKYFDHYVVHPSATDEETNLPAWKASRVLSEQLKVVFLEEGFYDSHNKGIAVAYLKKEFFKEKNDFTRLIPVDVLSIRTNSKRPLLLPNEDCLIILKDASNNITHSFFYEN
jgi:hypothetical protein